MQFNTVINHDDIDSRQTNKHTHYLFEKPSN